MIQAFTFLRVLVMLRRIHKELGVSNEVAKERLNLERDRLAMDHPQWYKSGGRVPPPIKMGNTRFEHPSVADLNLAYRERNPNAESIEGP